ncbi:flagellar basal body L-ring protein FlgH [Acuticoccus sp. I52.16.1]|uniref:flagellar basal body L-ring protein FlgH n=1 Tax=Acuticoccus sp. I52.16.1 TaxID=2928472 RepID=UPI001FD2AD36|nr:flagellar basal body L-ring protein FlgH [Acuticoccus sp. I52.16.1]UOM34301.1 flagellar basal body L-ring protein FlgH [Acuticoccus sp. I52.16.1]
MRRAILFGATAITLAGCADGTPMVKPPLTPVGSGLEATRVPMSSAIEVAGLGDPTSLYGRRTRELLTDVRASNVGDTLTVVIQLDDRASFDNESERTRESDADLDFGLDVTGQGFDGPEGSASAALIGGVGSTSNYKGTGAIDRSEKLRLRVAVVVKEVLPNGNIFISGSQEIRVNDELRELTVAGIVNPLDVTRLNTVDYERIAEARISYGGRGRQSEVQSPNWGQQIYDRVVPF